MFHIIEKLASIGSRNEKEAILRSLPPQEAETFKAVAIATYHPLVNYWVVKYDEPEMYSSVISLPAAITQLGDLSSRSITGNAAASFLSILAGKLSESDAKVLRLIINGDLRCGATATLFNKVWKDLIPKFELMACQTLNEKTAVKFKFPAYAQTKYDAARCSIFVDGDEVKYYTRNGKTYQIENEYVRLRFIEAGRHYGKPAVFDGELYQRKADGTPENRLVSNGIATKFIKGTASPDHHENIGIAVWDVIPLADFNAGKCPIKYSKRFQDLVEAIGNDTIIHYAETEVVQNVAEAKAHGAKKMAQGEEGSIIKSMDGIWEAKRSATSLKVKAIRDADLLITGKEEGTGKYVGMLGNINCISSDGKVKVNVGTGFSDEQRKELWEADITGKIAEIQFNELVQSSQREEYSLFLPRFVEIRDDKDEADTLEKLMAAESA